MAEKVKTKVPVILQMKGFGSGAASLAMVLAGFGKWVPLSELRLQPEGLPKGTDMESMIAGARFFGLEAQVCPVPSGQLAETAGLPCIVRWDGDQFAVVTGCDARFVDINNPACGRMKLTWKEFDSLYGGEAISARPSAAFVADGEPPDVRTYMRSRLRGLRPVVVFLVVAGLLSAAFGVIEPRVSQVFVDSVLGSSLTYITTMLMTILAVVACLQLLVNMAKATFLANVNGLLDARASSAFADKLLRLPMRFFAQHSSGDLLLRQKSISLTAVTMVQTVAPLFVSTISLVVYALVMFRISVPLALIGICATVANVVVARAISRRRIVAFRSVARDSGQLSGLTSSILGMMDTVKAGGCENDCFSLWTSQQACVLSGNAYASRINSYLGVIPEVIISLMNAVILLLGVMLIIQGQLTAGSLVAMQSLVNLFTGPAQELISSGQTIQEMRTDVERVTDVMNCEDDAVFTQAWDEQITAPLAGNISLEEVSFGYTEFGEHVLQGFSLSLTPGRRVALVGGSGSGKSTVAKLTAGLYQPRSGRILYDGRPLFAYDHETFTKNVALVDQNIVLFKGTFADAIRFGNPQASLEDVVRAAKDAHIYGTIMARGGLDAEIGEGGRELSGGQRQLVEIARALAGNPRVLIFDEATSALDAETESLVMDAVVARGVAMLIVAHRLSTVRDADEIIVLDKGRAVERGTHDDLMACRGAYYQLIMAD